MIRALVIAIVCVFLIYYFMSSAPYPVNLLASAAVIAGFIVGSRA